MNLNRHIEQLIKASLEAGKAILKVYNTNFDVELKSDNSPLTQADKNANEIITNYLNTTRLPILSEEGKRIPYRDREKWSKFWMVDPLDGTKEFVKRNGEFTVNIALIENGKPVTGIVYAPVIDDLFIGDISEGAYKIENASEKLMDSSSVRKWRNFTIQLPLQKNSETYRIVASRSHLSQETKEYIENKRTQYGQIEMISKGSSLKICLIAEGTADVYPRFAPTMEWDTAAGHAVVLAAGGKIIDAKSNKNLTYNKENLLNPWFIAFRNNT